MTTDCGSGVAAGRLTVVQAEVATADTINAVVTAVRAFITVKFGADSKFRIERRRKPDGAAFLSTTAAYFNEEDALKDSNFLDPHINRFRAPLQAQVPRFQPVIFVTPRRPRGLAE
jgi:hypothetical protein